MGVQEQARLDGVHPQEEGRDSSFQAAGRSGGSEEDEEQRGQEKERRAHRSQEGRDAEDPSQGGRRDQIRSRRYMENRHRVILETDIDVSGVFIDRQTGFLVFVFFTTKM